jgi:hypothetical protein
MAEIRQPYASGRWLVNTGSQDEFIERWTTFTQWSLDNAPEPSPLCYFGTPPTPGGFSLLELLRAKRQ